MNETGTVSLLKKFSVYQGVVILRTVNLHNRKIMKRFFLSKGQYNLTYISKSSLTTKQRISCRESRTEVRKSTWMLLQWSNWAMMILRNKDDKSRRKWTGCKYNFDVKLTGLDTTILYMTVGMGWGWDLKVESFKIGRLFVLKLNVNLMAFYAGIK